MSRSDLPSLLVTGASGHLGRRALELLADSYPGPLLAVTRSPGKIADLAARGVAVRPGSFDDDVDTLAQAFAGASRLLLISTDALDRPGRRLEQHQRAIAAAKKAGVTHLVYTSVTRASADSPLAVARDHWATEQALAGSGIPYTSLRNNLYTDFVLMALGQALGSGKLFAAGGDQGAAYVTREDCARAAAAALAQDVDTTRILEVSGPAAVTYAELAAIATELTGKSIQYISLTPDQLRQGLLGAGLPAGLVEVLVTFDIGISRGLLAEATSVVADLTGRAPASVRDFLTANRAALAAPPAGH